MPRVGNGALRGTDLVLGVLLDKIRFAHATASHLRIHYIFKQACFASSTCLKRVYPIEFYFSLQEQE